METSATLFHWIAFNAIITIFLGIDLWRSYRNPHIVGVKEALVSSAGWILLALLFNCWIYFVFGGVPALNFLTGYLVEKALSVDNLFVFLLIFTHFQVPPQAKHQVLFYGVLGAIVMRALLIWAGIALIEHFSWIFFIFGLFLIFTGFRLAVKHDKENQLDKSRAFKWFQKMIPLTTYHGNAFWIRQDGKWLATPLLAALIIIEITDLIFALDSVPAIFGITTDPFIVYTSNIFAILGLRSLFFALEGLIRAFYLLHYALAFILVFIGFKMLLINFIHIPTWVTFFILVASLGVAVIGSLVKPRS